jgi:hypothetical protein
MNLDHQKGHSLDELIQNLAETIAWCSSRPRPWSPLVSFRSVEIAPEFGSSDRKSWVDSVAKQRRRALGGGKHSLQERIHWYVGRLLTYFPDENLACGVAEAETGGFLTVDNVPPWDTWVAYLYEGDQASYLVSWVPGKMTTVVDSGIHVNPEKCFDWADRRCPHLVKSLAERGLKFTLK